jgi:dipeptidyl aminopeptidase/acylaminoacyl peptidase
MTERTNLDRDLSMYFEARSTTRPPAGLLDATLDRVDRTRQRAAWQLAGHHLADHRPDIWVPQGSTRLALAVLTLILALAIGLILVAGSQRRLPPPFGPARPGLLVVAISGHIGLMAADGTGLTMLTSWPEYDSFPIWSPDGTRFAFVASQDLSLALVVMDANGGHRISLADHLGAVVGVRGLTHFGSQIPLSWSPDSQRIVFAADAGDGPQLLVTPADRPGAARIVRADLYGVSPSWSPDGTLIAFRHAEDAGQPDAVWVIRPDGEGLLKLSHSPAVRDVFPGAAWSPDGKRLAFLAEGTNHSNDVYVINADGTDQRDVTNTPEDEQWASWSPDGTRLAFSWFEGADGTFVIDADGSNRVEIPTDGHSISTPAWSPDGSRILGYLDAGLMHSASDGLMVLDATGHDRPLFIPEAGFGSVTWQRLAP